MSKHQKLSLLGWISVITGVLTILTFLLAAEHRLTAMETNLNIVVEMQHEIRKETLPKIASEIEKLRDLYLGISKIEKGVRDDPRKPERLSMK